MSINSHEKLKRRQYYNILDELSLRNVVHVKTTTIAATNHHFGRTNVILNLIDGETMVFLFSNQPLQRTPVHSAVPAGRRETQVLHLPLSVRLEAGC